MAVRWKGKFRRRDILNLPVLKRNVQHDKEEGDPSSTADAGQEDLASDKKDEEKEVR